MSVHYEAVGAVVTVTIDRPEVRNAVDADTAAELADCFRRFEADEKLAAAVLTGAGGTFCAGYDLKSMASGAPDRLSEDGDGPMGPTRLVLDKPVIAAMTGLSRTMRVGPIGPSPSSPSRSGAPEAINFRS